MTDLGQLVIKLRALTDGDPLATEALIDCLIRQQKDAEPVLDALRYVFAAGMNYSQALDRMDLVKAGVEQFEGVLEQGLDYNNEWKGGDE